jgi:hypothetical protein
MLSSGIYKNAAVYKTVSTIFRTNGQAQTFGDKAHPSPLWIPGPGFWYAKCL